MSGWGYCNHNGRHTWGTSFPQANGVRQSPINIDNTTCVADQGLTPLETSYNCRGKVVTNTGYGWKVGLDDGESLLQGGPLEGKYKLEQFHTHWGTTPNDGSEHTVDGNTYSAEIHLVHWNCEKYASFEQAVDKEDGLAVLGVFFKVGQEHAELQKFVSALPNVEFRGDNFFIDDLGVDPGAFLPQDKSYYTYPGSLTTPPCLESVTWIVFKEPVEVSEAQLNAFRELKTYGKSDETPVDEFDGKIATNYRPPLDINERKIRLCQC